MHAAGHLVATITADHLREADTARRGRGAGGRRPAEPRRARRLRSLAARLTPLSADAPTARAGGRPAAARGSGDGRSPRA